MTKDTVLLLLLAPAAGLVVNALSQVIFSRLSRNGAHLRVQFASFVLGGLIAMVLLAVILKGASFSAGDKTGYFLLHLLVYASFGFCFFNMVNANISSLRVRMLKEYLARDPAPIPVAELRARYSASEMLQARLDRLQRGRQIEYRAGRFYLRSRGVAMIGKFFAGLRRLLLDTQ